MYQDFPEDKRGAQAIVPNVTPFFQAITKDNEIAGLKAQVEALRRDLITAQSEAKVYKDVVTLLIGAKA